MASCATKNVWHFVNVERRLSSRLRADCRCESNQSHAKTALFEAALAITRSQKTNVTVQTSTV